MFGLAKTFRTGLQTPSGPHYTQVSTRRRRSGRDAGTQAQGGETFCSPSTL